MRLGRDYPIYKGFNLTPLVTLADSLNDDVSFRGCPYAFNRIKKRK